ncbi:MAG: DUF58 domain-containing protein [Planctomycetota bacterium]|jgi:uncharacterized protein (DUF58 family)
MKEKQEKSRLRMTDAGRTVLRGTCFVALAALIVPAFGVLSALVAVLLMALLVGFVVRPRIRISGNLPERIVAGQTARLKYILKNVARMPAYNFSVKFESLPESIEQIDKTHVIQRLGPGESVEVTLAIRAGRRGHCRIGRPICESSFPFNLFSFATEAGREESLIVLPVFHRLHFPVRHLGSHVSTGGTRLAGIAGVFPEYAGNRPFQAGDSPRSIDSRAWARLASPAIKEYHDDFDNHAGLILDTNLPKALRPTRSGETEEFEAAVSLCASVAYTINNDCLIDMMFAGPDLHTFAGQPRKLRLETIHETLADVGPRGDCDAQQMLPVLTDKLCEVSEAVFVLLNWDEAYEQLVDKAVAAGCRTTVLMIDGSDRAHEKPSPAHRPENVRFLCPREVLKGQVKRL